MKTSLFALVILYAFTVVNAQCGCSPGTQPNPAPCSILPTPYPWLPLPPTCPAQTTTTSAPPCVPPQLPGYCPAPVSPFPVPLPPSTPCSPSPLPSPCNQPTTTPKPCVFVNKAAPIYVSDASTSHCIPAGKPIDINTQPIVISRPGKNSVQQIVQTYQLPPVTVDKKIIKISRPYHNRYYEEKYSNVQNCDCDSQVIPLPLPQEPNRCGSAPSPCSSCPAPQCY